jgi:hypothetical protein
MHRQPSNGSAFAKVLVELVAGEFAPSIRLQALDRSIELDLKPRLVVLVLAKSLVLGT